MGRRLWLCAQRLCVVELTGSLASDVRTMQESSYLPLADTSTTPVWSKKRWAFLFVNSLTVTVVASSEVGTTLRPSSPVALPSPCSPRPLQRGHHGFRRFEEQKIRTRYSRRHRYEQPDRRYRRYSKTCQILQARELRTVHPLP